MTWVYVHTCGALVYECNGWWEKPQLYCTNAAHGFLRPTPTKFPVVIETAFKRRPEPRLVDQDTLIFRRTE